MKFHSVKKQIWANQTSVTGTVLVMVHMRKKHRKINFVLWGKTNSVRSAVALHNLKEKSFDADKWLIIIIIRIHEKLGPENQVWTIKKSR